MPELAPPAGWPAGFWHIPHDGAAIPGSNTPASWLDGANCQRFAYGVLSLFGRECPPLRSSELWEAEHAAVTVDRPEELDLVLFNETDEPFGAHVGVWVGEDQVLHLCGEVGHPTVWPLTAFAERPRYATTIGYKRVPVEP